MGDSSPPELENVDKLRELALIRAFAAAGIVISLGALWIGWEIGGVLP
jgi:hypothetical protein